MGIGEPDSLDGHIATRNVLDESWGDRSSEPSDDLHEITKESAGATSSCEERGVDEYQVTDGDHAIGPAVLHGMMNAANTNNVYPTDFDSEFEKCSAVSGFDAEEFINRVSTLTKVMDECLGMMSLLGDEPLSGKNTLEGETLDSSLCEVEVQDTIQPIDEQIQNVQTADAVSVVESCCSVICEGSCSSPRSAEPISAGVTEPPGSDEGQIEADGGDQVQIDEQDESTENMQTAAEAVSVVENCCSGTCKASCSSQRSVEVGVTEPPGFDEGQIEADGRDLVASGEYYEQIAVVSTATKRGSQAESKQVDEQHEPFENVQTATEAVSVVENCCSVICEGSCCSPRSAEPMSACITEPPGCGQIEADRGAQVVSNEHDEQIVNVPTSTELGSAVATEPNEHNDDEQDWITIDDEHQFHVVQEGQAYEQKVSQVSKDVENVSQVDGGKDLEIEGCGELTEHNTNNLKKQLKDASTTTEACEADDLQPGVAGFRYLVQRNYDAPFGSRCQECPDVADSPLTRPLFWEIAEAEAAVEKAPPTPSELFSSAPPLTFPFQDNKALQMPLRSASNSSYPFSQRIGSNSTMRLSHGSNSRRNFESRQWSNSSFQRTDESFSLSRGVEVTRTDRVARLLEGDPVRTSPLSEL